MAFKDICGSVSTFAIEDEKGHRSDGEVQSIHCQNYTRFEFNCDTVWQVPHS